MKSPKSITLILFLLVASGICIQGWGFYAHKVIAKNAVFTLPSEMMGFYKRHLSIIEDGSVRADRRRYVQDDEGAKHYIDLDLYPEFGGEIFYLNWTEVLEQQKLDTVLARGILPWSIKLTYFNLTNAFKEKNAKGIIRYSSDLAHYVSDAHVPLHTTANYNGQLTNQIGIHGLWESRIPEIKAENYDFWVGPSDYISDVDSLIWLTIINSQSKVDSVLELEGSLSSYFEEDQKYSFEIRGKREVKNYSKEYALAYEALLQGMIERQMKSSVKMIGNLWYSSWIEAGQPDISNLNYSDKMRIEPKENLVDTVITNFRKELHKN